jgi:hypothetical protein
MGIFAGNLAFGLYSSGRQVGGPTVLEKSELFTLHRSFTPLVWRCVFAAILLVSLTATFIDLAKTAMRSRSRGNSECLPFGLRLNLTTFLSKLGCTLLPSAQGDPGWTQTYRAKLLLGIWLLCELLIEYLYQSDLLMHMMIPKPIAKAETFDDVAFKEPFNLWNVYVYDEDVLYQDFQNADTPRNLAIRPRLLPISSEVMTNPEIRIDIMQRMAAGEKLIIFFREQLEFLAIMIQRSLSISTAKWHISRSFSPSEQVHMMLRASAQEWLKREMDIFLYAIRENGLIYQWEKEMRDMADQIFQRDIQPHSEYSQVNLLSIGGISIVLAVGLSISILIDIAGLIGRRVFG